METRLNSKVAEILTEEDASVDVRSTVLPEKSNRVKLEDGTVLEADVVVANPDIPRVFDDLLESVRKRLRKPLDKNRWITRVPSSSSTGA